MAENNVVLFDTLPTNNGRQLGVITLNSEKSLNALSLSMIQALQPKLTLWEEDDNIAAVVMRGAGQKAFCAGGDIRQLYDRMRTENALPNPYALAFFRGEYSLYYQMYTYSKPIIVWASGIVMGGGLGLTAAASHRVVTDTTRWAMPEITIGLYPDAGGSWFLQRMPSKAGLFLGLTGAQCNGHDALIANLAEYAMPSQKYEALIESLQHTAWHSDPATNHPLASQTLLQLNQPSALPESILSTRLDMVHEIVNRADIQAVDCCLRQTPFTDPWLQQAANHYQHGCPATAALTWALFHRTRTYSIAEVLHLELSVSLHCCHNGDFQEGVRALLVDKDKQPQWRHTLAQCTDAYINSHFTSPFERGKHPFHHWLHP